MDKGRKESAGSRSPSWASLVTRDAAYRALVENVSDYAIMLLDREGHVRSWNAGAREVHGYAAGDILGQHFSALYAPAEAERRYPWRDLQTAAQLGRFEDEGWRLRKDGIRFWARVSIVALRDDEGELYGFGKIVRDLTNEKRREEALRRSEERTQTLREQAMKDPLTGAFNRRYLVDFLRESMDGNPESIASLFAIDIDHFKIINDRFGHDTGDEVLRQIAALANRHSRPGDRLFRIGGDEFLVHLPGVALSEARAIAERLRAAVEQAQIVRARPVTVSIGVAQMNHADSAETWIQRADGVLYDAKRAGRNRVV